MPTNAGRSIGQREVVRPRLPALAYSWCRKVMRLQESHWFRICKVDQQIAAATDIHLNGWRTEPPETCSSYLLERQDIDACA